MPRAAPVTIATRAHQPSHPLEHGGQALAAADAHRLQPVAGLAAVHLAQQRGQDPAAGRADRVAERDARAVDVGALEVAVGEAPLAGHRQHLAANASLSSIRSMSASLSAGQRQRLRRRRHRADAHRPRRHAGHAPGHQPGQRAQAQLGGLLRGGDDADGGAVVLAAGVAGGDGGLRVVLAHDRAQLGQRLDVRVGPDVLVAVDDRVALPAGHGHRDDLVGEPARLGGGGRALVAAHARTRPAPRARSCTRARRFSAVSIMPPGTGWFWPPAVTRPRASPSCSSTPGPALTPQRIAVE